MCEDKKQLPEEEVYQQEQIKDMASTTVKSERGQIHCITIVGRIVS